MKAPTKILLLGTLVLCAMVGAWSAWYLTSAGRWERANARFLASGLPSTLAELEPESVPRDENAAIVYREAMALARSLPQLTAPACDRPNVSAELRATIVEHEDVLALLEQAGERPRCAYPIPIEDDMVPIAWFLPPAKLLGARAFARIADGELDGALDDIRTLGRAARSLESFPTLLGQLIRLSIHGLACDALEYVLPRCESPLEALARAELSSVRGATATGLRAEAAWAHDVLADEDALSSDDIDGSLGLLVTFRSITGPYLRADQAFILDVLVERYRIVRRPSYPDAVAAMKALESRAIHEGGVLSRLMVVRMADILERESRTESELTQTRLAAACLEYRRRHGSFPDALTDLAEIVERTAPEAGVHWAKDPFSNKPFTLSRAEDGLWIVGGSKDGPKWRVGH